jgi:membrane associated rhomboid family serine protease
VVIDNVEVPSSEPAGTPEIIVEGPISDDEPLDVAEPSASASSWIFGFIVGLVIGGFIGRASWGLRRRRGDRIFG